MSEMTFDEGDYIELPPFKFTNIELKSLRCLELCFGRLNSERFTIQGETFEPLTLQLINWSANKQQDGRWSLDLYFRHWKRLGTVYKFDDRRGDFNSINEIIPELA